MAGAGTGPAAMPMGGGFGFAGSYGAQGMSPNFNRTGGPMNRGNTGQVGPGGPFVLLQPVQGGRDYMPKPPIMPLTKKGQEMVAGGTPGFDMRGGQDAVIGGTPGFRFDGGLSVGFGYDPTKPNPFMGSANAPGGDPTASLPDDKAAALGALNQTPPFNPAGGPTTQPMKQAPIRYEQEDFGPSNENVFERSARGVRAAMGATGTELGFQPSRVQGFGYDVGDVTGTIGPYAGDISGMGYRAPSIAANIGAFVNPFEQQVVEGALGDIERQRQMQANQLAAQFQAARGFGGSRQAIQEAELARSAMEQGAGTAASLRQQGFGQALQAAGQQANLGARAAEFGLGQRMQAQLANQAARQRFGEFAGGQSMQAQLANQAAQARAREFGLSQGMQAQLANQQAKLAGSQQRLGAASQLANLANLGFGMGQTVQQQMAQQGALQQQLQQQIMNAARQQFEGFRNYPAQALGYYAQALGATPTPQSSTTSRQPGLFDYLTLGLSL